MRTILRQQRPMTCLSLSSFLTLNKPNTASNKQEKQRNYHENVVFIKHYHSTLSSSTQQEHKKSQQRLAHRDISQNMQTMKYNSNKNHRFLSSSTNNKDEDNEVMVSIDEARDTTTKALKKIGWDAEDAALQAEIMTAAEVCGNNQGLVKMYQPELMAPSSNYAGKPTIEKETNNSAVYNANQSPGMLAAITAADKAIDLLDSNDDNAIAITTSYNTSTSSGQLAFYVERMAKKGYIGIALANSPEFVAAAPGGKSVFGTNPMAVGIPQAGSSPFTFDMATSSIALFGVLSAKAKGEALPPNVAYDSEGNWTTDATTALESGAIATFGGHKGAGLALVIELLSGALSGAAVLGQVPSKKEAKSWGHTMIAIRPNSLVNEFESKSASIINTVKESGSNIRIPGERSAQIAKERQTEDSMPIPKKIWESIVYTSEHGLKKN